MREECQARARDEEFARPESESRRGAQLLQAKVHVQGGRAQQAAAGAQQRQPDGPVAQHASDRGEQDKVGRGRAAHQWVEQVCEGAR